MEPMDLDDDSPHKLMSSPAGLSRIGSSYDSFCLTWPNGHRAQSQTQFAFRTGAVSSSTPVCGLGISRAFTSISSSTNETTTLSPYLKCQESSCIVWSPAGRPQGEQTLNQEALLSNGRHTGNVFHSEENISQNSSGRSDVSKMEVNQCSPLPSPSWDHLVSTLNTFSLFKTSDDSAPLSSVSSKPKSGEHESGLTCNKDTLFVTAKHSWNPLLTSSQSVVAFKRKKPGKKSLPPESFGLDQTEYNATPVRKLGKTKSKDLDDKIFAIKTKLEKQLNQKPLPVCVESSKISMYFKIFFFLLFIIIIGIVIQMYFADSQRNFSKFDAHLLKNEMASKVFGQHIAIHIIPLSLESYLGLNKDKNNFQVKSCFQSPLVFSFHGWTGVGKNFVSDIITSLFPVKTVTKILIPYHFPHVDLDNKYQIQVKDWILTNVSSNRVNFIILDEVDKATPGVVQGIENAFKILSSSPCPSPTVFLLLSNTLGSAINKKLFEAMLKGQDRESLVSENFSDLFDNCEDFWYQKLSSTDVVSVSVPFLPLEKHHIVLCIRRELVVKKLSTKPEIVARVLEELSFTELASGQKYSQTGCKRVSEKVDLVMFDHF